MGKTGGYEEINQDLMNELESIRLSEAATTLNLFRRSPEQVEIPFLGQTYLAGPGGVYRTDGREAMMVHGSVLAGYLLKSGRGELTGKFVPLDCLTGMVRSGSSYSRNRLESRLAKYAEKDLPRFKAIMESLGGSPGGEAGNGASSWIIHVLPKIPVQLIFYHGDEDFPAETRLLFDLTAVNFLDFEFLAVLATIFVDEVVRRFKAQQFS